MKTNKAAKGRPGKARKRPAAAPGASPEGTWKRGQPGACPVCGRPVMKGAGICPACGSTIDPSAIRQG